MYQTGDTIAAISSAPGRGARHIVRISGAKAFGITAGLESHISDLKSETARVRSAILTVEALEVPCFVYAFVGPHSYTGDDMVELHLETSQAVAARVLEKVVAAGSRLAEPGEFTARAYLNGKLDLAQAEAVAEVIAAGNRTQLAAAEKLLEGKLTSQIAAIRRDLLEIMSLIEAGLDFSEEGIDFITKDEAVRRLSLITEAMEELLGGSIRYEAMLDMPAVAIAGATNAGKSSLLNALLGRERAIVSSEPATTRDVLSDVLHLESGDCVIFDCAGLSEQPASAIDELAQAAAAKAVSGADLVILCVDVSKDVAEQQRLLARLRPAEAIVVGTKADMGGRLAEAAVMTSAKTGEGTEALRELISQVLKNKGATENTTQAALTQRHAASVKAAAEDVARAKKEVLVGSSEVASMYLRSAWDGLGPIEAEPVDEAILNSIFARFCIGK